MVNYISAFVIIIIIIIIIIISIINVKQVNFMAGNLISQI